MKFQLPLLDELAMNYKQVLVFDCEFWHVLNKEGDDKLFLQPNTDFFFIPREIGGFLLKKEKEKWSLTKPFFVTLDKQKRETVLPISKFSTVTKETAEKLNVIETKLGKAWGDAFYSRLDEDGKKAYDEGIQIYKNDSNIKKHHKSYSWYSKFLEIYSNSLIIVKGLGDIEALKNICILHNIPYKEPLEIIDIAEWNQESKRLCNTAKLAGTFDCIKKYLDKETRKLADSLPLEKEHDPSTDASMTLLVALYIQSQKP
jgi:hypothetical protein